MAKKLVGLLVGFLFLFLGMRLTDAQAAPAANGTQAALADEIKAKGAVLMDAETGRVLFAQNAHLRLPMASTTKIMTALIALEQERLDDYFTVSTAAVHVEGSSMGLLEGDSVSLRALAYGMLLPSGNDAANAAAMRIAGSLPDFADLMNARAEEIGLDDTHFVTPSGLNDPNHYSTAYDMALLAREALKNPLFAEICSQSKAVVQYGNPPYNRWMQNHNRLLRSYEGTVGVKTGYTTAAGRCLVSCAERDGIKLIAVTLNCPDDWNVHAKLYDSYFSRMVLTNVAKILPDIQIPVMGGTASKVRAVYEKPPKLAVLEGEAVTVDVTAEPILFAPAERGRVVGNLSVCLSGQPVLEFPLTLGKTVKVSQKSNLLEKLFGNQS
ncbi:D-alanyl-D-alanine carboxypeptidase family protein [Marasmitruncus massiliensis]|uniref:D-alanyl-D-alanine carboxypeptidase family protein n=1 Tax=Marasmitruncus massiliensis TaxID=1944642 RepID=UPI001FA939C6|nr:D-alanyl-D-alanine carboxypeptidase family protein [Marasmitruncus massiliensis]